MDMDMVPMIPVIIVAGLLSIMVLSYYRAPLWLHSLLIVGASLGVGQHLTITPTLIARAEIVGSILLLLNMPWLRRWLVTFWLFKLFSRYLPRMSETERDALAAGTVGWEAELFAGKPNFKHLLAFKKPTLSREEQAFLAGPVAQLCDMIDNWDITHHRLDMPPKMWAFIKKSGFFGMIIPKKYGGLQFSAFANSTILTTIATKSNSVATTISVPNSLGPAELLLEYGTQEQKNYYLPKLATGKEVPCFALTSPVAGSDASSIPDKGIICRQKFHGKETLGISLTWDKRYITLAPVATVLGLAFQLHDPEHLLGDEETLGITCALIPVSTQGVNIGRRHFPLNSAFLNGPTTGKDVFIPMSWVIGGVAMAGCGWRMLMECLAHGRGVSLPALAAGGALVSALSSSAYACVRKQFGLPISDFEGIEEVLASLGGNAYLVEALREFTVSAIDRGEKPALSSAICKYHTTQRARVMINQAMDIHAGKGICLGPKNYVGRSYQEVPIMITVEGANILTRCLIIFGQGVMRCHPYILAELEACHNENQFEALAQFDRIFFQHLGFVVSNKTRAFWLGMTGGRLMWLPVRGLERRYYRQIARFSAALAFVSDMALFALQGSLKRREILSARLGDILSGLNMLSAVLKRYRDHGCEGEDQPFVHWICQDLLYDIQVSFHEFFRNFPGIFLRFVMRMVVFPMGRHLSRPKDNLGKEMVMHLIEPTGVRKRLGKYAYLETKKNNALGMMEQTFKEVAATRELRERIRQALTCGEIKGETFPRQLNAALKAKLITTLQAKRLAEVERMRRECIAVDDFDSDKLC